SPMFGQDALSQTVCKPSSATRFLRSKNTSPAGIFIRIHGGFGCICGRASGATPCSASRTRRRRERVSTTRGGMLGMVESTTPIDVTLGAPMRWAWSWLAASIVAVVLAAPLARAATGPANKDAQSIYAEATAAFGLGHYGE